MSNPTSYGPLVQRIREVTEQGLGTLRTIPAGTFSGDTTYPERRAEAVARDVLNKPQITVRIGRRTNGGRQLNTTPSFVIEDAEIIVDLSYKLDGSLMRDKRQELIVEINNAASTVRAALTKANNLRLTADGNATGLASGMLNWQETTEPRLRWDGEGFGSVSIIFTGFVCLNYV